MLDNTTPLRRWLIVRQGAIGDTILLSSLIQTIRRYTFEAWIEVMGNQERALLLVGQGLADNAVSSEIQGLERLYTADAPLPDRIIAYLQKFDVILFFGGKDKQILKQRLQVRPDAIVHVHAALPSPSGGHCVNHYHQILKGLINFSAMPFPRIVLSQQELSEADLYLDSLGIKRKEEFLFAIHAGAGSRSKQAPVEIFAQAARNIEYEFPVVYLLTCGPADKEAVNQLAWLLPADSTFHILEDMPLRKLAAILSRSNQFIGNDSGITHMAAAVECPTTVFFVDSDPKIWSPLGDNVVTMVLERFLK